MPEQPWFMLDGDELDAAMGDEHLMPEGGDFTPTGFIGQFQIHHVLRIYSEVEPDTMKAEGVAPDIHRSMGPGYLYLFRDYDEAVKAQKVSGSDIKPQAMFYPEMPTSTVINFSDAEALGKWGNTINGEIRKVTLASKYRHEAHFMFVPKFVEAYARLRGWSVPSIDLEAVDVASNEFVITDELQQQLVGNAKRGKAADYQNSQLRQQQAALWLALGESNPDACHPSKTQLMRGGKLEPSPLITTSPKLDSALTVLSRDWLQPVWGRIKLVCVPVVGAETKDGKALSLPIIFDLYKSEAEAKAAYAADLEKMGVSVEDAKPTSDVPEAWVEMPEAWKEQIDALKEKGAEATLEDAKALTVTLAELRSALAG